MSIQEGSISNYIYMGEHLFPHILVTKFKHTQVTKNMKKIDPMSVFLCYFKGIFSLKSSILYMN